MKPLNRVVSHVLLSSIAPVLLICLGVGLPQIYGLNYGIVLDNTCLTMIRNNVSSDCPTYEDIITLFPDTSIRDVSGDFGYTDGIYQRFPTKWTNSFEYYRFSNTSLLFVDPPPETRTRINLIEIKANLDDYLLRGKIKSYNPIDHTLTLGYGRYVDSCRTAYVDASQWSYLVGDSIQYMSGGCTDNSTTFNSKKITYLNKTKHDIATSYKWKLEQWYKESLLKCGTRICIYEKNQTGPPQR